MVNVVGLGYMGLPTALMMATHGVEVIGTDCNHQLVESLRSGHATFQENGLELLLRKASESGITFTTEYPSSDVYIISVPTPFVEVSRRVDPIYVLNAVRDVLKVCPEGATLVIESTIPPGTIDEYVRPIIQAAGWQLGTNLHLAHAPERIITGNMLSELENNARVIGADDPEIGEKIRALYATFCCGEIVVTDIRTAEMSKVVENTFRAVNIAFANELSLLSKKAGVDVHELIQICNMHPRVNILQPGPGVGGHCISVDPWFLVGDYPEETHLIRQAMLMNESMPEHVLERIIQMMKEHGMKDLSRVGLYGISFKENVDDYRDSPTLQLLKRMHEHGMNGVRTYDPMIHTNVVEGQFQDFDAFLKDLSLLVVMVGHDHIRQNADKLAGICVLDTRYALPAESAEQL